MQCSSKQFSHNSKKQLQTTCNCTPKHQILARELVKTLTSEQQAWQTDNCQCIVHRVSYEVLILVVGINAAHGSRSCAKDWLLLTVVGLHCFHFSAIGYLIVAWLTWLGSPYLGNTLCTLAAAIETMNEGETPAKSSQYHFHLMG